MVCELKYHPPPLHPSSLHSPQLLTQARSVLASSVPQSSGCPVAPPTCGITSARTTTTESLLCPPAVCHARLACLVCSPWCRSSTVGQVFSSPRFPPHPQPKRSFFNFRFFSPKLQRIDLSENSALFWCFALIF